MAQARRCLEDVISSSGILLTMLHSNHTLLVLRRQLSSVSSLPHLELLTFCLLLAISVVSFSFPQSPKAKSTISQGFLHTSLSSPTTAFQTPYYGTTTGIDYAGNKPSEVVRVGQVTGDTNPQIALSSDYGATWHADYAAPAPSASASYVGGQIAYSANADTLLWSNSNLGVLRSANSGSFAVVSGIPTGAAIAADKVRRFCLHTIQV